MKILSKILLVIFSVFLSISCEKENIPPTCEISSPDNGEEFDVGDIITISVDAEDADGTIDEVRFYIDDISVGSASSFPYNYEWDTKDEDDGIVKIKVSAKDDKGVVVEDEISILLNPGGEPPVAAFSANKTSLIEGESVQFTDQSTNEPTGWQWDFGDDSTSTSQNPSHTYTTAGTYEVSLTVTNTTGSDSETKSGYITVITNGGETGTVTDIEGNVYKTITIGTQEWMAENLKTTKYNDGTSIPLVTGVTEWSNLTTPGYCWYDNDETTYKDTYGALYNWYTVNTDKLCPSGWHVPTDTEWTELENYLIANGYNYDGTTTGNKIGKSLVATSGWNSSSGVGDVGNDQSSNNATGFSAFPGGYRYYDGNFRNVGDSGYWWSSSESSTSNAYSRYLHYYRNYLGRYDHRKHYGFSVRCLRD